MSNPSPQYRQLVQVKQIFLHGRGHALGNNALDRLHAIISLDMAVESLLTTVISESNNTLTRQEENNFDSIFEKANLGLKIIKKDDTVGLPHKNAITNKVHKLRNGACHHGNIPSPEDLNLALGYTEAFLSDVFKLCFNKDFDEVFLADMIEYPEVLEHFKSAEKALANDDLQGLSIALAKSFAFFLLIVASELPGWVKNIEQNIVLKPFENDLGKQRAMEELMQSISVLQKTTLFLSLGATLHDLTLYIEKLPIVNISTGRNAIGVHRMGKQPTMDECIQLMNVLYNMILTYQSKK